MDALIGYTGFVGSHLARQHCFNGLFNSSNISAIGSAVFDTVVCAAAPGSMFEANMLPDVDRKKVDALIKKLKTIRTKQFVLISSIAVLENAAGNDDENTSAFQSQISYGKHRRMLEVFCQNHFDSCLVIRLPALFGKGLRKNFIFDMFNPLPTLLPTDKLTHLRSILGAKEVRLLNRVYKHDKATGMHRVNRIDLARDKYRSSLEKEMDELECTSIQFHNKETTYQYYDITRLWNDISIAKRMNIKVMHLATPPLKTSTIYKRLLGRDMPTTNGNLHNEDMYTVHASLWGSKGPYLTDIETLMCRLEFFFNRAQRTDETLRF